MTERPTINRIVGDHVHEEHGSRRTFHVSTSARLAETIFWKLARENHQKKRIFLSLPKP